MATCEMCGVDLLNEYGIKAHGLLTCPVDMRPSTSRGGRGEEMTNRPICALLGYAATTDSGLPAQHAALAKTTWCGRETSSEFCYVDAGHLLLVLRNDAGSPVCSGCAEAIMAMAANAVPPDNLRATLTCRDAELAEARAKVARYEAALEEIERTGEWHNQATYLRHWKQMRLRARAALLDIPTDGPEAVERAWAERQAKR